MGQNAGPPRRPSWDRRGSAHPCTGEASCANCPLWGANSGITRLCSGVGRHWACSRKAWTGIVDQTGPGRRKSCGKSVAAPGRSSARSVSPRSSGRSKAHSARRWKASSRASMKSPLARPRLRRFTAQLRPRAREVAVKVLRPGIEEEIGKAIDTYEWAAAQVERFGGEAARLRPRLVVAHFKSMDCARARSSTRSGLGFGAARKHGRRATLLRSGDRLAANSTAGAHPRMD